MRWIPLAVFGRMNEGIRKGAFFLNRICRMYGDEFTWFMGRRYKLVDAADHIGYEWTGRAHGSLADALATLAVQRWLEQWLVAE